MQLWNVGYLAVYGFRTWTLDRQEEVAATRALEGALQQASRDDPQSAQYFQTQQKMRRAIERLAATDHTPLAQFLAEITHVEVKPSSIQFDGDEGIEAFCEQLNPNLCAKVDAATHRARLNAGKAYCQVSVPCWDDLSPTPPQVGNR
jgi:hypothetical protein